MLADAVFVPIWHGEDEGTMTAVLATTRPGEGDMVMPGQFAQDAMEGLQVAVSWAASHVGLLCRWLMDSKRGSTSRSVLWHAGEQLSLARGGNHRELAGPSVSVGIALSLACMVGKRVPKSTVAVTGHLDLRGNVLDVGGLQGKLRGCQQIDSITTLLVPEESLAKLSIDDLPSDLRAYATRVLRGVRTMTDVIRLAVKGQ